ncbi:MAG TPA: hypothetical protein ENI95_02965 [Chloroflexi bacterium]|nr:hypothetical protein [Chloroflexota bacterium]
MNPSDLMRLARGPLFYFALLFFIAGMLYRLTRVVGFGWKKDLTKPKKSKIAGSLLAFVKSVIIWPFIPRVEGSLKRNLVAYFAGGLFHLALFLVVFLGAAHMLVWKSLLGFGWPTLPLPVVDWLAAAGIVALLVLFINRLVNPVLRTISHAAEYLNLLFVFLPMLTGFFLTHHLLLPYEAMFALHVLSVDWLLIWIPLSRISHFVFYFFSKAIYGAEFARRGAQP